MALTTMITTSLYRSGNKCEDCELLTVSSPIIQLETEKITAEPFECKAILSVLLDRLNPPFYMKDHDDILCALVPVVQPW